MAGVQRALVAAVLAATMSAAILPSPSANAQAQHMWYAPKGPLAFPVLLPADGRWLNWIDTFGAPRMRFENGVWVQTGTHQGVDIFAEKGSPIVALAPGVIENVGWQFYSGYRVGVRGNDGRYYFYAHMLQPFASGIQKGSRVVAGQVLGRLGNSGYGVEGTIDEFPPHLHFGLQLRTGKWINPQDLLLRLYNDQIADISKINIKIQDDARTVRLMASRVSGPASPGAEAVKVIIATLAKEREALQKSLLLQDLPG